MREGFYSNDKFCLAPGVELVEAMANNILVEWIIIDHKKGCEYSIKVYHAGPVFVDSCEQSDTVWGGKMGARSNTYDTLPKKWAALGI